MTNFQAFLIAAVLFAALWRNGRRLEGKIGPIHAIVEDVNRAVNHRPNGEPTLYEHASETAKKLDEFITYQHDKNHSVINEIQAVKSDAELTARRMDQYVAEDSAAHDEMRERLAGIESRLP